MNAAPQSPIPNSDAPAPEPYAPINPDSSVSKLAALEQRLAAAEAELTAWRNLQVDPASGGGGVVFGENSVFLRINGLTPASAQIP